MAIPIIAHVAVATQALPIVAILAVRGRRPPDPYRRIAVLFGVFVVFDVVGLVIGELFGTNLFIVYVTQPIEVALTLWVLASWQPSAVLRQVYSTAIPVVFAVLATSLALLGFPGFTRAFDSWLGPGLAILSIVSILQTLVHRTLLSRDPLGDQEWFWVCLGLSLFWLANFPLPPIINAYIGQHLDWVWALLYVRICIEMIAYFLVTWGVLCNRQARYSGRL